MIKLLPKRAIYIIVIVAMLFFVGFYAKAYAQINGGTTSAPVVTLKLWSDSSEQEQYAFLAGFVSMIELEKEWQGQKSILALEQSMVGSWAKGMDGMTLKTIRNSVNKYVAKNPNEMDKLVLEVLWRDLVQPKLRNAISPAEKETPNRVRDVMETQKQEKNL